MSLNLYLDLKQIKIIMWRFYFINKFYFKFLLTFYNIFTISFSIDNKIRLFNFFPRWYMDIYRRRNSKLIKRAGKNRHKSIFFTICPSQIKRVRISVLHML